MSKVAKHIFIEPDLLPNDSNETTDSIRIVEQLDQNQILQLHRLIQQQWWGTHRSLDDVRTMVQHTSLMIGLIHQSSGQLVGYCRMLTDFVFRATLYDVMVDSEHQGIGLGKRLLNEICHHPRIQNVSFIYLACETELFSFYKRWEFDEYTGKAKWMIKIQREE